MPLSRVARPRAAAWKANVALTLMVLAAAGFRVHTLQAQTTALSPSVGECEMAEIDWGYEVSAAPGGFVVSGVSVTRLPDQCAGVPVAVTLVGAHGVLADIELDQGDPSAPASVVRVDEVVAAFAHPKV